MKAICPISGIPFRTYDSLPLSYPVNHPIFSVDYYNLIELIGGIQEQELELLQSLGRDSSKLADEAEKAAGILDLTNAANLAIHEHNWKNPAFRLYQTKQLVLLALMVKANLLEVEKGYAARPEPKIIDSHFWQGVELFSWANTLTNPQLIQLLPRYKINRETERFTNLNEYLDIFAKVKENIGNKFRSASTERRLAAWEQAIAILTRRRTVLKTKLSSGNNSLVARWALTITNTPSSIWEFWFGILSSSSTKITFDGVKVGDRIEHVTPGDLRELYDWLDDNLIRPKGGANEYHRDDSEFYFMARQTALEIVRTHILILEQGTSSYRIVNSAMGSEILSLSDDALSRKASEKGLAERPKFEDNLKKIDFIRAMAAWRTEVKQKLLDMQSPEQGKQSTQERNQYEIL